MLGIRLVDAVATAHERRLAQWNCGDKCVPRWSRGTRGTEGSAARNLGLDDGRLLAVFRLFDLRADQNPSGHPATDSTKVRPPRWAK